MTKFRYLLAVAALVFVSVLIVFAPARIVPRFIELPAALSYSGLEGSFWRPTFTNVHWRSRAFGDVRLSLKPLSAVLGLAKAQVELSGLDQKASGLVTLLDGVLLEDFEAESQMQTTLGTRPVAGLVKVSGAQLAWDKQGQCTLAQASLTTNIPAALLADFDKNLTETVANFICEDGRLSFVFEQGFAVGTLSGTGKFVAVDTVNLELVLRFAGEAAIPDAAIVFMRRLGFEQKQNGWYNDVVMQL